MDPKRLQQLDANTFRLEPRGPMRVPVIFYADHDLIEVMDEKVLEQASNVASLPGVVGAVYAMPDAHWGYGFPIGGVAAFEPDQGVVSIGGVGFDISCGVRNLITGLRRAEIDAVQKDLADALFEHIPAGLGSRGAIRLDATNMRAMLNGGAAWAVAQGFGTARDLEHIEEHGCMEGADPDRVSDKAKERQRAEMGTLGSGNHYLEVQEIAEIFDAATATAFGLSVGEIVVSIHCGSRGLGHQVGTDYLKRMQEEAARSGFAFPDPELACAPLGSPIGQAYLAAMRAGINCALANRQIITHLTREVFARFFPHAHLDLLYDVSHNTCKQETHTVDGQRRPLYVHRKGATRAFGPGQPELAETFRRTGQPVLVGGSMGASSYILVGTAEGESRSFSSACHGAGRAMSRHEATRRWRGRAVIDDLAAQGILIRSASYRGVAEEAPGAYKDVDAVVNAAHQAGLARKVARLRPLVCVKG